MSPRKVLPSVSATNTHPSQESVPEEMSTTSRIGEHFPLLDCRAEARSKSADHHAGVERGNKALLGSGCRLLVQKFHRGLHLVRLRWVVFRYGGLRCVIIIAQPHSDKS